MKRVNKSHSAGLSLARNALVGASTLGEGIELINAMLSDSKGQLDCESGTALSNEEVLAGAGFFWALATKEGLKPAELAEVIRRLAVGEYVHDVLPQRFLALE